MYVIQLCFICPPSDSTVSEDAGIEPRTVATLALTVRRSNHLARSHPQLLVKMEDRIKKKTIPRGVGNLLYKIIGL
jgi:hypothetical protein